MAILAGLEPAKVFRFFEEICAIPHGSGNTKQISDYCAHFARQRGLRTIQDESNNLIIFKPGTAGYETSAPVILQGHMDMVCEKTGESTIDFTRDGLTLQVEHGIISAVGTTLGGDDGIAVAYALALLDADDIPHPPLEVILTVDEEIGMLGAAAMDCSMLKGRRMLNMDSEEEGCLLVSCAGGADAVCHLPVVRETVQGLAVTVTLSGLLGGHSGVEIHKGRGNANQLLGRVLYYLGKEGVYRLVSVAGGLKDNAIPREAVAELVVQPQGLDTLKRAAADIEAILAAEYRVTDPDITLTVEAGAPGAYGVMDAASQKNTVAALMNLPGGVQRMSADIDGLVQTSLNLGILQTFQQEVRLSFSLRSSVSTEKDEMYNRICSLMEVLGGTVERSADYPAWEYNPESPLRDLMIQVYEEQWGKKPEVQAMHAGLECGLFAGKLPGLDCVSFGPDMKNIHTTSESMDTASVRRTWEYLLEILRRLK